MLRVIRRFLAGRFEDPGHSRGQIFDALVPFFSKSHQVNDAVDCQYTRKYHSCHMLLVNYGLAGFRSLK